jgi:protein gp37
MASSTNNPIGWCDVTWNPVRGCSRVSPGCDNCYAMGQAHRYAGMVNGKPGPFFGLTTKRKGKVDWSGSVRFVPEMLDAPLRWRQPQRIFVNSMSDLFHHSVTDAQIMRVWLTMARARWHTFQILTKRADRMAEWVAKWCDVEPFEADPIMARGPEAVRAAHTTGRARMFADALEEMGPKPEGAAYPTYDWAEGPRWLPSVLPNVWLGVSAEDQERADERIPHLLATPAAVRFASAEPLIGALDLDPYLYRCCDRGTRALPDDTKCLDECCPGSTTHFVHGGALCPALSWVIVGGESGPGARVCHVDWVRSIVKQCRAAGVAVFCKQLGTNVHERNDVGFDRDANPEDTWDLSQRLFDRRVIEHNPNGFREEYQGAPVRIRLRHRKGGDETEWPEPLRVRQFPAVSP